MKPTVCFYLPDSIGAVELYTRAFGLTLGYNVKNPDGTFYHSELYKGEEQFISVVERQGESDGGKSIQLCVELENENEVRSAFAILSDGGSVDMPICELPWSPCAGCLTDKYGISWYLSANSHQPSREFDESVTNGTI